MTLAIFFTDIRYPGFNSLKVRDRGGMPVAFADFEVPVLLSTNIFLIVVAVGLQVSMKKYLCAPCVFFENCPRKHFLPHMWLN